MAHPDQYDQQAFVGHLYAGIIRETKKTWAGEAYKVEIVRKRIFKAVEDGVCVWELAISLDLLALTWDHQFYSGDLYHRFELPTLLRVTRNRRRSEVYWRHVYFSRYARTEAEADFYRRWLATLDVAEEQFDTNWGGVRKEAADRLRAAEVKVRQRGGDPVFRYHAVKELAGDS